MAKALLTRPGLLIYALLTVLALFSDPGRGWWAAVTFGLICIGVGHSLLTTRAARGLGLPGTFGKVFAGLVGWWLLLSVMVLLCTFNALSAWSAGALSLLSGAAALHFWWKNPPAGQSGIKFGWALCTLGLVALVGLAPYLIRTLVPDSDWDGALYHLPMAQNFVTDGLWKAGFQPHSLYRPGVVHSCYAFFHALDLDSALIPLNTLAIAATAYLCQRIGSTFWDRQVGTWGAGVFLSSCLVLELAVDVRVEPFLMLCFLATVAAGMLWLRERGLGNALVCAMCGGLLAGMKYNGLMYAGLVLGPTAIALWALRGLTVQQRLQTSILALLVFAIPSSVFYARNQALFGNALHPYKSALKATGQTHEEMFGKNFSLAPEDKRPPKSQIEYLKAKKVQAGHGNPDKRSKFFVLFNAIRNPMAHTSKPFHWISPWLLAFLLVPAFARDRLSLGFFGFGLGSYFLTISALASKGDFPVRYLAPLMPILALGTGICLARVRQWIPGIVLAVGVALPIAYGSFRQYHFLTYLRPDKFLSGQENELEYLARVGFNGTIVDPDDSIRFANTGMPDLAMWLQLRIDAGVIKTSDRLFMIAEAKTSRLPIDCLPSNGSTGRNFLNRLKRADWNYATLHDKLWDEGFRFVLINKGWMHWTNAYSVVSPEVLVAALHNLDQFIKDQCEEAKLVPFDSGNTLLIPLKPKQ
ncbi:MAG: hypothetical protein VX951_12350 [Planctomycetota bacterium]|nr:hypothetical protein [Planctomycetota bacterium]